MDTSLFIGRVAKALHGADLAYFVAFIATAAVYRCALWLTAAKGGETALKPR